MNSAIEELYYGNITPSQRSFRQSGEYARVLRLITHNEEELVQTLTEAQKQAFEKYKDSASELEGMMERTNFILGFKLGLRLTAEAFISSDPENDLISK